MHSANRTTGCACLNQRWNCTNGSSAIWGATIFIAGSQRNLHPTELYANGLSPQDISNSLGSTNVIIPSGTVKIGDREYSVELNGSPLRAADFNQLPIKVVDGTPVLLGDVAPVTNTHSVQTNVVRVNGKRATYLMIIKHAAASTLAVNVGQSARDGELVQPMPAD